MGHQNQRHGELLAQRSHEVEHLLGVFLVQVAGGLVRQHQVRLADKGAGDGDSLPFAAGQFRRAVRQPLAEAHGAQHRHRFGFRLAPAQAAQPQRHQHVLQGGELQQKVVQLINEPQMPVAQPRPFPSADGAHRGAADSNLPAIRVVKAGQQVQQRALAGSGTAENRHPLAASDLQGKVAQDLDAGAALRKPLAKARGPQHRLTHGRAPGSAAGGRPAKRGRAHRPGTAPRTPRRRRQRPPARCPPADSR